MAVKIFFCYAREDELLLSKLKAHLSSLQRQGLIDVWYDREISAGIERQSEINKHLNEAQIILLLVSPDFMDSDYCYGVEMAKSMEKWERGDASVIPIILRHVYWQGTPFGKLQVLPKDAKPILSSSWYNEDEAFLDVTESIHKTVITLLSQDQKSEKQEGARALAEDRSLGIVRSLPVPSGSPPYHLSLDQVLSRTQMEAIRASGKLIFHILGNTGGNKSPENQEIVARHLEEDCERPNLADRPAFFYHLGNIVYGCGEANEYYAQFYEPYLHYTAPIFAIPGDHDGDIVSSSVPSLTAFMENFCAPNSYQTVGTGNIPRTAMIQPNVYWTLETPFATIIGIYTNVPEGGWLDKDQIAWLETELHHAPIDKVLILATHHPIYSLDRQYRGSTYMSRVLDGAIQKTNRIPDIIFSSHVHNYQRFTRLLNGRSIPYIIVGAGGHWRLHRMQTYQNGPMTVPLSWPGSEVTLESYCDDRHGYMRVEITPNTVKGEYFVVPRLHEAWNAPAVVIDDFTLSQTKQNNQTKQKRVRKSSKRTE